MFSLSKKENTDHLRLALSFHTDAISVALVEKSSDGSLELKRLEYRPVSSPEAINGELKILGSELGLKDVPCILVLNRQHYALLQVEAPEVEGDELKSAVRWRIKDLIDFHIDDAVIDTIMLPASRRPGAPRMMYVVAARKSYIQEIVDRFDLLGINLQTIDIPELTLRNLTFADAEENRASALLYLKSDNSLIDICENGSLCLSRRVHLDTNRLDADRRNEVMDMLSLEIQRSLDYYESQFANGAVSIIHFVSDGELGLEEFSSVAGSYLMQPVAELTGLSRIAGLDKFSKKLIGQCLPTIGGALRDFVWAE